jgi:hypothetical protein
LLLDFRATGLNEREKETKGSDPFSTVSSATINCFHVGLLTKSYKTNRNPDVGSSPHNPVRKTADTTLDSEDA